jgi:hypothetical protein
MIGKMKIFVLVFSLVIVGSATTLAMDGDQENDAGCKDAPKTMYAVHLAEVEAIYDHEIYLLISSDNGEPICGIVEILPPKFKEREYREERECREEKEREERDSKEEEHSEEEYEEEEEREEECDEERKDERSDDEEECKEKERDECYRKKEERRHHRKNAFRFNFKEGKGRFLLFSSSHRCLGATALITLRTHGKVKITPFIYVKNTDVVVYPDSKDEEGQYCEIERIKGGVQYSFEDLLDSPEFECDWDYDDVILYMGQPFKKKYPQKEDEDPEKEDVVKEQKEKR